MNDKKKDSDEIEEKKQELKTKLGKAIAELAQKLVLSNERVEEEVKKTSDNDAD